MKLAIALDPDWTTVWHRALVAGLAGVPGVADVTLHAVGGPRRPAGLAAVMSLEGLLDRGRCARAATPAPVPGTLSDAPPQGDLVLDLVGTVTGPARRLTPFCSGMPLLPGASSALLAGETPRLELVETLAGTPRSLGSWAVAVEDRRTLLGGLDGILGRAGQLIRQTVAAFAASRPPALPAGEGAAPQTSGRIGSPAAFCTRSLASRVQARLQALLGTAPQWQVAWRPDRGGWSSLADAPFRILPTDGRRFYADPFVWRHDGRTILFVEELPFATGRGIISACEIGPDGPVGALRPVLDEDCHLSYPYLLEDGGTLFMIPETSARRTVELWRCVRFPDRFERDTILVSGADLSDATVFRAAGRWHMLATSRDEDWSSTWDALDHWTAPTLRGPWSRRGDGPVALDVRRVRPAGAPFVLDGHLHRPVQDSALRYGGALALLRMDPVADGGFIETEVARAEPPSPFLGIHTYNRTGGLEVIDLFGRTGGTEVRLR